MSPLYDQLKSYKPPQDLARVSIAIGKAKGEPGLRMTSKTTGPVLEHEVTAGGKVNPTGSSLEGRKVSALVQIELQVGNTSAASIRGTDNHAEMELHQIWRPVRAGSPGRKICPNLWCDKGCRGWVCHQTDTGAVRSIESRGRRLRWPCGRRHKAPLTLWPKGDGETWMVDWKSSGRVTPARTTFASRWRLRHQGNQGGYPLP